MLLASTMMIPVAHGQDRSSQPATVASAAPHRPVEPIVPDSEFDTALPSLSGDINAPLEPMWWQPCPW